MHIRVKQITKEEIAQLACSYTTGKESNISLDRLAMCEHSPLRTQMFTVEMINIPTFVSVHLVRHKIGVEHFVKSNREDRGGESVVTRTTPVSHMMFINAQALIFMSRKRLCFKASKETRKVMEAIRAACPRWLQPYMMRECEYRGGVCHELLPCPELENVRKSRPLI